MKLLAVLWIIVDHLMNNYRWWVHIGFGAKN